MTRRIRDRDAERDAIRAASARLLTGTPRRSTTGKLTGTELITESGLRRDVVYGDHKDLVQDFQARVKAQDATPEIMQKMAADNAELKDGLTKAKQALAAERERNKALTRAATELSLELEQAREELASARRLTRLPVR